MACRLHGRCQAIIWTKCWNIVNWTLRNKHQWNLNRKWYIFIQENAFEHVVWKMAAILSRPLCVNFLSKIGHCHYNDVIMGAMASQITNLTIVYSTVYSGADQRKHQSSVSLAFVRGIHRSPVNSPHKWPVMRKRFPFDDVIMWVVSTRISPPLAA